MEYFPESTAPGLSPCARGTQKSFIITLPVDRFIPVCSGNASQLVSIVMIWPVYPRVLGERFAWPSHDAKKRGLSPCARGTQKALAGRALKSRFIPVCSGNATPPSGGYTAQSVYPRVLGERAAVDASVICIDGLSPCARGTPSIWLSGVFIQRFIPVCSGNAKPSQSTPTNQSVYPRVLGERKRLIN